VEKWVGEGRLAGALDDTFKGERKNDKSKIAELSFNLFQSPLSPILLNQ
jgi:hypothetical protein